MPTPRVSRHNSAVDDVERTPYLRLPPTNAINDYDGRNSQRLLHVRWCLCCSNLFAAKVLALLFLLLSIAGVVGNILSTMMLVALPVELLDAYAIPFWIRLIVIWSPLVLCTLFSLFLLGGTLQKNVKLIRCAFALQAALLLVTVGCGIASVAACIVSIESDDGFHYYGEPRKHLRATATTTLKPITTGRAADDDAAEAQFDRNNYGLPPEDRRRALYGVDSPVKSQTAVEQQHRHHHDSSNKADSIILVAAIVVLVLTVSIVQLWFLSIVHGAWKEVQWLQVSSPGAQIHFYNNHNMIINSDDAEDAVAVQLHNNNNGAARRQKQPVVTTVASSSRPVQLPSATYTVPPA